MPKLQLELAIKLILSALVTAVIILGLQLIQNNHLQKTVSQNGTCKNCNLILISIDDLRADRLGINGYQKPTSPNIDKFFKNGLIFENAFSQAPWTLPSHASFLTGKYPKNLNIALPADYLPNQAETLAETLRENGYTTGAITTSGFVTPDQGFAQGFDFFLRRQEWQDAEDTEKQVINFLRKHRKEKFFLFLHTFQVHDPYSPSEKQIKKIDPGYKGKLNSVDISQIVAINKGLLKPSDDDLKRISALYDGEIREIDQRLGKIFSKLKRLGLDKNTVVIIVSDHGEEFGERGIWGMHAYSLYNELIHVPLLVKTPENYSKKIPQSVELVDLFPTILDYFKIKPKQAVDGTSLLPLFTGEGKQSDPIFSETALPKDLMLDQIEESYISSLKNAGRVQEHTPADSPKAKSVIKGNLKLIKKLDSSLELYDLENDPEEKVNLIDKNLPQTEELKTLLDNY